MGIFYILLSNSVPAGLRKVFPLVLIGVEVRNKEELRLSAGCGFPQKHLPDNGISSYILQKRTDVHFPNISLGKSNHFARISQL